MENASKALIIAAAILLSILIIALGMRVYNSASKSTENANLSAEQINSFNSQFTSYSSEQSGTTVKALITKIQKSNENYDDRKISILTYKQKSDGSITATAQRVFNNITNTNVRMMLTTGSAIDNPNPADYNTARNAISEKAEYLISFDYDDSGLIDLVKIDLAH